MLRQLMYDWWVVVLRGVIALLFGFLALAWPSLTLNVLVMFFGAYVFVDGVFAIITAFTHRAGHDRWWVLLIEGLIGIGAGIITLVMPGLALLALVYLIAGWAVLTGIMEVVAAVRLRKEIEGEWMLILSGIASLVLGILILFFPAAGVVTIAWLIGIYAILFGIMFIALGLRLRKLASRLKSTLAE